MTVALSRFAGVAVDEFRAGLRRFLAEHHPGKAP